MATLDPERLVRIRDAIFENGWSFPSVIHRCMNTFNGELSPIEPPPPEYWDHVERQIASRGDGTEFKTHTEAVREGLISGARR